MYVQYKVFYLLVKQLLLSRSCLFHIPLAMGTIAISSSIVVTIVPPFLTGKLRNTNWILFNIFVHAYVHISQCCESNTIFFRRPTNFGTPPCNEQIQCGRRLALTQSKTIEMKCFGQAYNIFL